METKQEHRLLTKDELARFLGVKPGTLAAWRYRQQGPPAVKVGHLIRYRPQDVVDWLDERQKNVGAP
jgi:predicted DNA-binding transcriptional regulator AlpA